jgi:nitrate reductase alpha subunit
VWGADSKAITPPSYDDENLSYTPAWQERYTGIDRQTVIQFAREWATTAEKTEGKCMIIIGAGVNHWYHNNLIYRACIGALMLTGCVGRNGGGLNHYVGQENWLRWRRGLRSLLHWIGRNRLVK